MFTEQEKQTLIDALDMAIKSNKRQAATKPQYSIITNQIDTDLHNLQLKIKNLKTELKRPA